MTMPTQDKPTIGIAMSAPLVVTRIKSRLFGGKFLRFHDFVSIMGFMHHNGLVLAEAMPAQHLQLMYLFGDTIDETGMAEFLRATASERLKSFRELTYKDPASSIELMLQTEYWKTGVRFSVAPSDQKSLIKASERKVPLESTGDTFTTTLGEGIAFGFACPELASAMLKSSIQTSRSTVDDARRHGLKIPPDILDVDLELEDDKKAMVTLITNFATQHRPDLLGRLNLSMN